MHHIKKESDFKYCDILDGLPPDLKHWLSSHYDLIQSIPGLAGFKSPQGLYLACNRSFEKTFGVSEDDILGQTDDEFLSSELAIAFDRHHKKVLKTGRAQTGLVRITLPNHDCSTNCSTAIEITYLPIFSQSRGLIGILYIGNEIGDRPQSIAEGSQAQDERFALAMQGANDGLWDWNLDTDEVYYSPRWKSMLGYEPDELEHTFSVWASLVHRDDKADVLAQVWDYIFGESDSFEVEMRMRHKQGHDVFVLSRAFLVHHPTESRAVRLVGTHVDITARKKAEIFSTKNAEILEMIASGRPASDIYHEIALMYEDRHPGLRCSMLELEDGRLLHGGAPSLPKEYCEAIHGLKNGPNVGSCGTSTYTGKRVLVENIETDPKWAEIKHVALPHGMRCCWSEPIKSSAGQVLGAFGMYYNHPALPNDDELADLIAAARLASIVMERDQAQKQIRELAYTDTLTGVASRAHFYQMVEDLIKTPDRHQSSFSLLYLDLDDFKGVNDSLGHDAGDLLLQEIAHRLNSVSRRQDFVARLSGDEFCILIKTADRGEAESVAQRCLVAIARPIELCGRHVTPACSIGVAHYPKDGRDSATLLKAADTSLYSAKERGKNQYVFYDPTLTQQAEYRFQVEQYLRTAVEQGELSLVYQPQVCLKRGQIIGLEALSRWHHPKLGEVSPNDFIATAEKIGVIRPLTEWVLRAVCNQAVTWCNAGLPHLNVAVNISAQHFLDDDFVPLIQQILDETGMSAHHLELEVTESVVQTDTRNLATFESLKRLGVLLAIDDFGTGYSSFASLKHLTVDSLKLDKYFVDDMMVDSKSQVLIESMIKMGHDLGYGVIAEGIETPEQLDQLRQLGCDAAQGYLFSKPISGDEISKLLMQSLEHGQSVWFPNCVA